MATARGEVRPDPAHPANNQAQRPNSALLAVHTISSILCIVLSDRN